MQVFIKSKSKDTRICIVVCSISIGILIAIFSPIIMLFFFTFHPPEHIVEKDNKKYVVYVHAFLDTRVEYYDYVNFFIRGTTKRIEDNYDNLGIDVLQEEHEGLYSPDYTYYYNDEGRIINESHYIKHNNDISNKNNEKSDKEQRNIQYEESKTIIPRKSDNVLYKKEIGENIVIRVRNLGAILGQRSVVQVEKSTNGGKIFEKMTENEVTIHNGAEFIFIDENIGFINDFGFSGTGGDNRFFVVTTDGGRTFANANVIHPDSIEEKNLIERKEKGTYVKKGKDVNEFFLIQRKYKTGIFSHNTALYFYNLTDRTPLKYDLTFKNNIRVNNEMIEPHYIREDKYENGLTKMEMPDGTTIKLYNMERTIIDILRDRNKTDLQIFNTAMNEYIRKKEKNLIKLSQYAKEFKVENILKKYMEVLL